MLTPLGTSTSSSISAGQPVVPQGVLVVGRGEGAEHVLLVLAAPAVAVAVVEAGPLGPVARRSGCLRHRPRPAKAPSRRSGTLRALPASEPQLTSAASGIRSSSQSASEGHGSAESQRPSPSASVQANGEL